MRLHYHSGPASARVRPQWRWPGFNEPDHAYYGLHGVYDVRTKADCRRMGFASRVMAAVCRDADAESVRLVLMVGGRIHERRADRPMSNEALASWYERFGFQRWYEVESGPSIGGIVMHRWAAP